MSLSGISTSSLFNYETPTTQNQTKLQQFQQEFKQLGEDLQSGNLSAAQSDFATLQQAQPQNGTTSSASSNPLQQAFHQLAQDLQSVNLSGAQQDDANIQQDFQSQAIHAHGHHHHHGGGEMNQINQTFEQLGQALQSGDISSAQQAYSTLQEDQQLGVSSQTGSTNGAASTGASVTA